MILVNEKGISIKGDRIMVGAEFCGIVNAMRNHFDEDMMKYMFELGMKDDEDLDKEVDKLGSKLVSSMKEALEI